MSVKDSIIKIFQENDNKWLEYGEIYEKLDKTLFGPNKYGEQGRKNIVARLMFGNINFFDVDENFRPKKYRLKSHDGKTDKSFINTQIKYSLGESTIYFNNDEYNIVEFSEEEEFEDEVAKNYKMIFGENSIYFNIKKKLGQRICDGFVFDKDLQRLIIVENELCIHDLWDI